jgi:hypothetical protein
MPFTCPHSVGSFLFDQGIGGHDAGSGRDHGVPSTGDPIELRADRPVIA